MNRENPRSSLLPIDNFDNLSANPFHSLVGYIERHLLRPCVTTAFFPSSLRNFAGTERRFLSSIECVYSPMNIVVEIPFLLRFAEVFSNRNKDDFPRALIHLFPVVCFGEARTLFHSHSHKRSDRGFYVLAFTIPCRKSGFLISHFLPHAYHYIPPHPIVKHIYPHPIRYA